MKAEAGELDLAFYIVQAVAMLLGSVNLTLMTQNVRAGLALTRQPPI